jgi:tRNA modification GTPase
VYRADTIVACATAAGPGAIAVVRLSGPEAFPILDRIVSAKTARNASSAWRLHHGTARDPQGRDIDDVLSVRMPGPRTYTGEDVVEIQCHGSPLVIERLIAAATSHGARPAERGEFTRRAVLNGRMDLLQAEAVADLIDARCTSGAELAWAQLQGALSQRLAALRDLIVSVLADVEANVDFSDDELPAENVDRRLDLLARADEEMSELLAGFPAARRWREGHRVVFAGRPNAGKSSLVNALLGYGRMIVSPEPGTTRDTVEEIVDVGGVALVLIDTAGVRETTGAAEAEAVARARRHVDAADILVHVIDAAQEIAAEDRALLARQAGRPSIVVLNKNDLGRVVAPRDVHGLVDGSVVVETSALTGAGCDALARALVSLAGAKPEADLALISRVRHRAAVERARAALDAARTLMRRETAPELACIELRGALSELASITDPVDNEDVLDRIFATFCIGK